MNKICVNFRKHLLKFCTCFSEKFDNKSTSLKLQVVSVLQNWYYLPTTGSPAKLKLWGTFRKIGQIFRNFWGRNLKKYGEIFDKFSWISCNFQENLKEPEGIYRKYAIIVESIVEILWNFQGNSWNFWEKLWKPWKNCRETT